MNITVHQWVDGITIKGSMPKTGLANERGSCALSESDQKELIQWFKENRKQMYSEVFEFINENVCPYCGSENIGSIFGGFVYNNDAIEDQHVCNDCDKKFWFIYKCVRVEDMHGHEI